MAGQSAGKDVRLSEGDREETSTQDTSVHEAQVLQKPLAGT